MSADEKLVVWGREVLECEAASLHAAARRLDKSFIEATRKLLDCQGKVVVCGLGKSGHVGRKIAATFASTGTPSFFLHPSEALHGDLGMLHRADLLLAIAYSGETSEVLAVSEYARRHDVPVISITGNLESSLARLSDVALNGNVEGEADGLGLAPTSSSTLALAIGDALAVSAMKARGFTESDFASVHPGGKLGKRLAYVSDFMHPISPNTTLNGDSDFHLALKAVTEQNFGIAAVLDAKGRLIGAVTDGDIRRFLMVHKSRALDKLTHEFMSSSPTFSQKTVLAVDAVDIMNSRAITNLFIVDEHQKPVGLLRMHDLLAAKIV